jgi:peptide-methionine (S)-S-oxide reductase
MKKLLTLIFITQLLILSPFLTTGCKPAEQKEINDERMETDEELETAVFGGGCFWSIEAIFSLLKGVTDAEVGYAGGFKENPTYEQVCQGNTGHAEVVKITFDPNIISYSKLLEVFFYIHNPTTLNRQGNDVGGQYRSIILYTSPEQEKTVKEFIDKLEKTEVYSDPIVTEVEPLDKYYKAEDYHQDYFKNNSIQPYCGAIISPKVKEFQNRFADLLNEIP